MLVDLINQRKRFFAQQRAKAKRNKPMTQAQQRTYMSNYIKHQEKERFDRDDPEKLWDLVKKRFRTTEPAVDKEKGYKKCKEKGEDGPKWVVQNKFEDELANFMLEKKFHTNGIREMLGQHRKEMHEQFSQIFSTIRESKFPKSEAPTFAITTRSGINTRDPPFPTQSQSTPTNHAKRTTKRERLKGAESSTVPNEETPLLTIFYQPSKSSNLPFLSRVKKQKKDDDNERLLSIFKQIHINLPFL
ncbi:hypothetical protein Tco_0565688 [Tanacetum coccineum]